MPDREMLALIQRSAERWAKERGPYWCTQLQPVAGDATVTSLIGEIDEQGWIPESLDAWGDSPILTLAQSGRMVAREVPAAFVPVLAHCLGLHLLLKGSRESRSRRAHPIATSPYIDCSQTLPTVIASPSGDGWLLAGEVGWLINAVQGCTCVLAARLPTGTTALFEVNLDQTACSLSEPLPTFGLWGVPVRRMQLSSAEVSSEALVATGHAASELLSGGYRAIRWGALGMLLGIVERLTLEATEYATLRLQGGRRIIDHAPVRHLLDTMTAAADSMAQWIQRLENCPELNYTASEIRRHALRASDCGLQVFGGSGYICPGLPERCWRDVRQVVALCG